jgi:hypothetical protein
VPTVCSHCVQRRAAYAAKKEAAQLEAALAASKSSAADVTTNSGTGAAATEMSEEEMLAQAMQASLAVSQVLQPQSDTIDAEFHLRSLTGCNAQCTVRCRCLCSATPFLKAV